MFTSIKPIIRDQEFWLIIIIAIGFGADAAAERSITILRSLTILVAIWLIISHINRKLKLQKEKKVPFLIVIGKTVAQQRDTRHQVETALENHKINLPGLKKTYGLVSDDWIYYQENILPSDSEAWSKIITKIENQFWRLSERIYGRKVYQIFINGPAALAMGLGATIGSRTEFTLFHFMPGTGVDPYHNVIDFSPDEQSQGSHILKTRVSEYKRIKTKGIDEIGFNLKTEVLVSIHLAGHNPTGDVERRAKETGLPHVVIGSIYQGTIPLEDDWILLSQEIDSVLLGIAGLEGINRLHLFISMPLPIAFAVGSALGKFVRATVYNYSPKEQKYFEAIYLEQL